MGQNQDPEYGRQILQEIPIRGKLTKLKKTPVTFLFIAAHRSIV